MEFSEGIGVGVEEDFVQIGDIQLPDDDYGTVWEQILCYL